jgi:hypothetical protein
MCSVRPSAQTILESNMAASPILAVNFEQGPLRIRPQHDAETIAATTPFGKISLDPFRYFCNHGNMFPGVSK